MVFRHFPLEGHPRAFAAAVAAECAGEQDAFWPYHDKLFAEGGDLDAAKFLALASSLGLDQERFRVCLQSEHPRREVEAICATRSNSACRGRRPFSSMAA
ncbi:MAG: thioredoxin domain-containing protein [Chthoniobacter sp.]